MKKKKTQYSCSCTHAPCTLMFIESGSADDRPSTLLLAMSCVMRESVWGDSNLRTHLRQPSKKKRTGKEVQVRRRRCGRPCDEILTSDFVDLSFGIQYCCSSIKNHSAHGIVFYNIESSSII